MDPITLVVTAVALGAAAGLKETAAAAVKDAYGALKKLLARRNIEVTELERKPGSEAKQASLREDLEDRGVVDEEILEAARRLTNSVAAHDSATAPALGIDLQRVEAEFLRVQSVKSEGTGIRLQDGRFSGGIDIGDVRAGREGQSENP